MPSIGLVCGGIRFTSVGGENKRVELPPYGDVHDTIAGTVVSVHNRLVRYLALVVECLRVDLFSIFVVCTCIGATV